MAIHEARTAPGCFARIVLRKHGLDPDRDLECVARAPGDYQMDLRRLRDGSIDAAYVGSTLAPEEVADEEGFSVLSWAGDHFQIPTVGIAVDPAHIPLDDPALQALVRANRPVFHRRRSGRPQRRQARGRRGRHRTRHPRGNRRRGNR